MAETGKMKNNSPNVLLRRSQVSKCIFDHVVGGVLVFKGASGAELKGLSKWGQIVVGACSSDQLLADLLVLDKDDDDDDDFEWVVQQAVHLIERNSEDGKLQLLHTHHGGIGGISRFLEPNPRDPVQIGEVRESIRLIVAPTQTISTIGLVNRILLAKKSDHHSVYHIEGSQLVAVADKLEDEDNDSLRVAKDRDRILAALVGGTTDDGCWEVEEAVGTELIVTVRKGFEGLQKLAKVLKLIAPAAGHPAHSHPIGVWVLVDDIACVTAMQELLDVPAYDASPCCKVSQELQLQTIHNMMTSTSDADDDIKGKWLVHLLVNGSASDSEAVIRKKTTMIRLLVQKEPCLLDEKDGEGHIPLLLEGIHLDILKLLIALGSDVSAVNGKGQGLLHLTTRYLSSVQYHELVERLIPAWKSGVFDHVDQNGWGVIHYAVTCLKEDVSPVTLIIFKSLGLDFNLLTKSRKSPLAMAMMRKRGVSVVQTLIQCGADWEEKLGMGLSLLHLAAAYGNLSAIRVLVKQEGIPVNLQSQDGGATPLHAAFYGPSNPNLVATVNKLVQCGADVNAKDSNGESPLHYAIVSDDLVPSNIVAAIEVLVSHGGGDGGINEPDQDGDPPLISAVIGGKDGAFLDALVKHGADLSIQNKHGWQAVQLAADVGNESALDYLLSSGKIDVNIRDEDGNGLFHFAVGTDMPPNPYFLDVAPTLLKYGADINARNDKGLTPLQSVTTMNHISSELILQIIQHLISLGADVNVEDSDGYTMLHNAPFHRPPKHYHSIVQLLIELGLAETALKQRFPGGGNALKSAVVCDPLEEDTLKLLLNYVDINEADEGGETALFSAVKAGRNATFLFLMIVHGADPEIRDNDGYSLAHFAAGYTNLSALKFILSRGDAGVNDTTNDGSTPLHVVSSLRKNSHNFEAIHEVIRVLLKAGANPEATDHQGRKPVDVARTRRSKNQLLEFIEECNKTNNSVECKL